MSAQLSDPYDPDFPAAETAAPAKKAPPEPLPTPPENVDAPPDLPVVMPYGLDGAGPFLLYERPDPNRFFQLAPSTKTPGLRQLLIHQRPFRIGQQRWTDMRRKLEEGTLTTREFAPPPIPSYDGYQITSATQIATTLPDEVELPSYGTSLSVTGRKVISFNYSQKRFLNEQKGSGQARDINLIDIEQQLQLRMQGKVGPKITVNVDYDDTKQNKQDISVVYTGDPNEVVQNASFGDIDLSLPATEFVSYNKQLFGIRVDLKWKRFDFTFVGSRTKGTTKTKQFKGNTQFVTVDLLDSNYMRRRYYDLTFGDSNRLPIAAASERIFIARESAGQQNVDEVRRTVDDLAVPPADPEYSSSTFTGNFIELSPGLDYTIDYVKGVLTFRNSLNAQDVVAVGLTDATGNPITLQKSTSAAEGLGGSGRFKIIKAYADVAISTPIEAGYRQELKTFYNVGRTQIVRDNGRGNFFLKVLDQNRNEVAPVTVASETIKYPETIEVDFENGLFQLKDPFAPFPSTVTETNLYNPVPISQGLLFQLDFKFRLKTFFLEPNLVLQSETILLDGARLTRNVDYFIDYESGFLTFFNEQRIREDSTIDVNYEVAPFAGIATESLLGVRTSYKILKNEKWKIGTTMLYQTDAKPPTIPTVNELAENLLVYEGDTQLTDIRLFSWLRVSFAAEIARSHSNPNLFGKALIENMEGTKDEDSAAAVHTFWQFASNPGSEPPFNHLAIEKLTTEDVKVLEINPNAQVSDNDTQKVLALDYDFGVSASTEISIVYTFSVTGEDFSQKNIFEITMKQFDSNGNSSNNEINFHLGGINEDADGDGILDTEDTGLDGIADTNDNGELDGRLQPNEDVGYLYNPPCVGCPAVRLPRNEFDNGRIDSEDLNRNGRLDPADFSGGDFGYVGTLPSEQQLPSVTDNAVHTFLDFTGWHTFQVPLNISSATSSDWQAIKQLRISVRRRAGGAAKGSIRIARAAAVGNTWERGAAGDPSDGTQSRAAESLIVNAVNNVDNPGYQPIFSAGGEAAAVFDDLFGEIENLKRENRSDNVREQALELRFKDMATGTTVYTRRKFSRALDISQHYRFNFLLHGSVPGANNADKVFFLRAGTDKDFFEVRVPLPFNGWRHVIIEQADFTGDQIPDVWQVGSGPPGTVIRSSGSPNIQQIGQLTAGIYCATDTVSGAEGAVWLNEIHVKDPITRKGKAEKLQFDFQIPKWATFGGKYRFVDRNYRTPTTLIANQDNRQDTAYLNFTKLSFLPMNFNLSRLIVTTPNTSATGSNSNLVTLLQEGRVITWQGSAKGSFNLGRLPRTNMSYERRRETFDLLTRLDNRETYDASVGYSVPWRKHWLPQTLDLTGNHAVHDVSFESRAARLTPGNFNTRELTRGGSARLSYSPWSGSTLNPNYSLSSVIENRGTLLSNLREDNINYHKSMTQSAGFTSSWKLLRWLKPTASYSIDTRENNILNISTFTVSGSTVNTGVGDIKTINRNSNGNVSLTLNAAEIYRRTRLFRSFSLTNSYQLKDGDVWNNVETELDTKKALWIRSPLRPRNSFAEQNTLTLRDTFNSTQRWSPLEAYNISGRKAAFKTFSLTNNFVKSIERNVVTNTPSRAISTTFPDAIASLGQLEKLIRTERFMKNMQLNLKYALRDTHNVNTKRDGSNSFGTDLRTIFMFWRNRFDTTISFNMSNTKTEDLRINEITQRTRHRDATLQATFDIRKFRFTPKADWRKDVSELGTGTQTTNTQVITPSLLIRADLALPRGLYLPIARKTLTFTNRIIWTTSFAYTMRDSPVTLAENDRILNFNTSADYEIAKNLRMTLNGAASRLWHKYLKENEFLSYQFGTTLTFQF